MALITIGTSLIDVADVALVAPRGAESTVYLADSQQLESALSAAAQAAAVNGTAAGTVLTTVVVSSNFGSCYISGPNTQRVVELSATGTTWYLRGGPGPVICPATDLAAAEVLIDATGGAEAVAFTYSYSSEYDPEPSPLALGDWAAVDTNLDPGALGVSRFGSGAGVPSAGDTVTVFGAVAFTDPSAEADGVSFPLPFLAASGVWPVVFTSTNGTDWGSYAAIESNALIINITDGTDTTGVVRFSATYQTANATDPE